MRKINEYVGVFVMVLAIISIAFVIGRFNKVEQQNSIEKQTEQIKIEKLENLFDSQIQTLRDRECPEQIIEKLISQRKKVIARASTITIEEGNTPFIPVIPLTIMDVDSQIEMIRNGNKIGYNRLNPNQITDVVKTPEESYYIFNVEDGTEMLDKSPKEAEKLIKEQNRSPLTVAEVIALGIHTDVLLRHRVDATGSRFESPFESSDLTPNLYVYEGRSKLYYRHIDSSVNSDCGSPSAGIRISF